MIGIERNGYLMTKGESMSDLIRRDDAIIAVCLSTTRDSATDAIKELPTAEPKVGKWIDHSDEGYVECPFCGSLTTCEDNIDELHYCFNCGAKMERSE